MIERLRMLSSPVRYAIYVAGVILLFVVALGVGATAAAVVGWHQPSRACHHRRQHAGNDQHR
jgi:hypothetical protein